MLRVPGATLFYRVRGTGPLLLILASGHGDADTTDALCKQLIDHYTVVTYDRRGLSRSAIDSSAGLPTIAMHSDDAHQLLAALTTEPSLVFGSSIGALIGLDLMARGIPSRFVSSLRTSRRPGSCCQTPKETVRLKP